MELRRKLLSRGFGEDEAEEALERLGRDGLLNDAKLASAVVRHELETGHGPAYIRAKLRRRGLPAGGPLATAEEEAGSLRRLLQKRGVRPKSLTGPKERAKMLRFLRGRGYTATAVEAVLGHLGEEGQV